MLMLGMIMTVVQITNVIIQIMGNPMHIQIRMIIQLIGVKDIQIQAHLLIIMTKLFLN